MHEMSIALNIIKIAEEELEKANGKRIESLNLVVGKLSGVVVESLNFALEASREDGPLSNTKIIIDEIPAKMKCLNCGHKFQADDFYTTCPTCNEFRHEIISGKELLIKSMTIE